MLQAKKITAQTEKVSEEDKDIDCVWAVLQGKRLGFGTEEVKRMRYGEFVDYLITTNEMIEKQKDMADKKKEKRASLADL